MDESRLKDVISFIVSFLVDRTGNDAFDGWRERYKIRSLLKKDCKNIKNIFHTEKNTDLYNLVEEFILLTAFKEPTFYSAMELSEEQEDEVWTKFVEFIRRETNDNIVSDTYKKKIIRCINLHNQELNKLIMDEQARFQTRMHQIRYNSIDRKLKEISNTLNNRTALQEEKALEKRIDLMRDSLWNIQFELYQDQIYRLYKIDRNCD